MIKELDGAILTTDLPEYGLRAGDVGTVVHVYGDGKAYIVEFMTLDGETIAVVELEADQVKPERGNSVPHARPLSLPRSTSDS